MTDVVMDTYRYVPPTAASFTHTYGTNSENPTTTDTTGRGLVFGFGTNPVAGNNVRAVTKNKASSSNYDLIVRVRFCTGAFGFTVAGLVIGDGTKLITWGFASNSTQNGGIALKMDRWSNGTTFSSERLSTNLLPGAFEWLRIGVVSSDPSEYYVSENGTDWIKMLSESQTGFLTYTEVGVGALLNRNSGSFPVAGTQQLFMSVLYFKDPDIVPGV